MVFPVYIAFGANLGDRTATYERAVAALEADQGVRVTKESSLYETEPVGLTDQGGLFLNSVMELETSLSVHELMAFLRELEARLGKAESHRSDRSRAIDLDLLLYGNVRMRGLIELPHPRMHTRAFVLVPLAEIAPSVIHPILRRSMEELRDELPSGDMRGVRHFRNAPIRSKNENFDRAER